MLFSTRSLLTYSSVPTYSSDAPLVLTSDHSAVSWLRFLPDVIFATNSTQKSWVRGVNEQKNDPNQAVSHQLLAIQSSEEGRSFGVYLEFVWWLSDNRLCSVLQLQACACDDFSSNTKTPERAQEETMAQCCKFISQTSEEKLIIQQHCELPTSHSTKRHFASNTSLRKH